MICRHGLEIECPTCEAAEIEKEWEEARRKKKEQADKQHKGKK